MLNSTGIKNIEYVHEVIWLYHKKTTKTFVKDLAFAIDVVDTNKNSHELDTMENIHLLSYQSNKLYRKIS